ncbi:MAG: DUF2750 domain-containing protein [Moraxellaceae bacterium]|nr:DUF2750 domain-containing protein [Moraxellaceae bacterium]
MSQSSAQLIQFFTEITKYGVVWTIKDDSGFPAPLGTDGRRTMPFWSSQTRAENIIRNVPAYHKFQSISIDLNKFQTSWLSGLRQDKLLVGTNWTGRTATGFDLEPEQVLKNIEYYASLLA